MSAETRKPSGRPDLFGQHDRSRQPEPFGQLDGSGPQLNGDGTRAPFGKLDGAGQPERSDPHVRFARAARVAQAGLVRWARFVRPLPFATVREEDRPALRGLVGWYERVCADERYTGRPPREGIDALLVQCQRNSRPIDNPALVARGAIRVAEELVAYRRLLEERQRIGLDVGPEARAEESPVERLERATQVACERLDLYAVDMDFGRVL